jgi:hypothetical protein
VAVLFCANCGAPLEENDRFCLNCGSSVDSQGEETAEEDWSQSSPPLFTQTDASNQPSANTTKMILMGGAAILAVILLVGVYFSLPKLFGRNDQSGGQQQVAVEPGQSAAPESSTDDAIDDVVAGSSVSDQAPDSTSAQQEPATRVEEVISRATVSASSVFPHEIESDTGIGYDYYPEYILDGNFETAWIEGVDGSGKNEWIQISLPEEATVSGFYIQNGFWRREDRLAQNNRITQLRVEFSDGTSEELRLSDPVAGLWREQVSGGSAGLGERIVFSQSHETSYVRLVVIDVVRGSKWDDTAISGIQLFS